MGRQLWFRLANPAGSLRRPGYRGSSGLLSPAEFMRGSRSLMFASTLRFASERYQSWNCYSRYLSGSGAKFVLDIRLREWFARV